MQIQTDTTVPSFAAAYSAASSQVGDFRAAFAEAIEKSFDAHQAGDKTSTKGLFVIGANGTMLMAADVGRSLTDDDRAALGNGGSFQGPMGSLAMALAWVRHEGALTGPLTGEALDKIADDPTIGKFIDPAVIAEAKANLAQAQGQAA